MTNIQKINKIEKIKLESFIAGLIEASEQSALEYASQSLKEAEIDYRIAISKEVIEILFIWKMGCITHYVGSYEYPNESEVVLEQYSILLDKDNKKKWYADITLAYEHIENSLIN